MTTVNTVLGEISSGDLGVVLMHEHLYANNSGWWHCPSCKKRMHLAEEKVNIGTKHLNEFEGRQSMFGQAKSKFSDELPKLI